MTENLQKTRNVQYFLSLILSSKWINNFEIFNEYAR